MEYEGRHRDVLAGARRVGTVGVLVLANFGGRRQLRVAGRPVGRVLDAEHADDADRARRRRQLHRDRGDRHPARRPPADPGGAPRRARPGARRQHRRPRLGRHLLRRVRRQPRAPVRQLASRRATLLVDDEISAVFAATVEATEESVLNALFVADTVTGRDGNTAPGLPVDRVLELLVTDPSVWRVRVFGAGGPRRKHSHARNTRMRESAADAGGP